MFSLTLAGDTVYIGGTFFSIGREWRNSVGAVNLLDGGVLPFNPDLGTLYVPSVFGMVVAGTNLIMTGSLPNGSPFIADAITGQSAIPGVNVFGVDGPLNSLGVLGTTLYVGGDFSTIAGHPRTRLAAFDVDTLELLPWAPTADGAVGLILPRDQSIIAVGSFSRANEQARTNIAVFDAVTGQLGLGPTVLTANGQVRSLAASSNTLYLAGDFTQVNGSNATYFGAVDLVRGDRRSWNPSASDVPLFDDWIGWQTVPTPQSVAIAGRFETVGGFPVQGVAVFPITNHPPQVDILAPQIERFCVRPRRSRSRFRWIRQ